MLSIHLLIFHQSANQSINHCANVHVDMLCDCLGNQIAHPGIRGGGGGGGGASLLFI